MQYALPSNMLVDVAYAGNAGVHLLANDGQLNQLPDQYLSKGNALNQVIPNPFLGILPGGHGPRKGDYHRIAVADPVSVDDGIG